MIVVSLMSVLGGEYDSLKGGKIGKAVIKNITSFVMAASPIFRFEVDSTVYGVLVGGKITGGNKVDFYALPNLKEGLPGLSGAGNDLTNMIQQANSTFQLVGVPFINIPMVIKKQIGQKYYEDVYENSKKFSWLLSKRAHHCRLHYWYRYL